MLRDKLRARTIDIDHKNEKKQGQKTKTKYKIYVQTKHILINFMKKKKI